MPQTSRPRSFNLQSSRNSLLARQLAIISATLTGASQRREHATRSTASRMRAQLKAGKALVDLFTPPLPAEGNNMDPSRPSVPLVQRLVNYPSSPSVPDDHMVGAHEILAAPIPELRGGEEECELENVESLMRELSELSAEIKVLYEGRDDKGPERTQQCDIMKQGNADSGSFQARPKKPLAPRLKPKAGPSVSDFTLGPTLRRVSADRERELKMQHQRELQRQQEDDAQRIRDEQEQEHRLRIDRLIDFVSREEGTLKQILHERERVDRMDSLIDYVNQQEEALKPRVPLDNEKLETTIAAQFEIAGVEWESIQAKTQYLFRNGPDGYEAMKDKYDFVCEAEEELNALAKRVLEEEAEYHARQLPSILSRRLIVSNIAADAGINEVAELFVKHQYKISDIRMVHRDPVSRTQTAHIDMFTDLAARYAVLTAGSIYGLIPKMHIANKVA